MNGRSRLVVAVVAAGAAAGLSVMPAAGSAGAASAPAKVSPPAVSTLKPGRQVTFTQRLRVNVVLVGYAPAKVENGIRYQLAQQGKPVVREPLVYGLQGRD